MSDDTEVEVTGTPEETAPAEAPVEPTVPLDPSSPTPEAPTTPSDPEEPAVASPESGEDATAPAEEPVNPTPAVEPPPVTTPDTTDVPAPAEPAPSTDTSEVPAAAEVELPPEPVAPPPPPPVGDAVAAVDAADDQARADQAQREKEAFALSTNGVPPRPVLPPPLANIADVPTTIPDPSATEENSIWICVTEEGPRTAINNVECPVFAVAKIPPQGKLIACPTCGGTVVRRATDEEQRLLQPAGV